MCSHFWISVLVVVTLGHRCVETCREGEFALQDSTCCPLCAKGWYIIQNCTTNSGVRCHPCKKCQNGLRTTANCTCFSDTKCENVSPSSPWMTNPSSLVTTFNNDITPVSTSYATVTAAVIFLLMAGVWRWCITHKYGKPFKILEIDI